ncbi:MAG: DUF4924 family protein, partial [Alloprevotella sp.]
MIIAQKLRHDNRAEYLLYMWQVEEILRLFHCDIDRLSAAHLSRFHVAPAEAEAIRQWYAQLCSMMRSEGKMERGHLQINETTLTGLEDLHHRLLASPDFPTYRARYERVLPYIVELRAKSGQQSQSVPVGELRPLFGFLYGIMMLRLQKRDISDETERAAHDVAD